MKNHKSVKLAVGSLLAALVLSLSLPVPRAWASALGTWLFPAFICAVPETHTGTETHSGAVTESGTRTVTGSSLLGAVGTAHVGDNLNLTAPVDTAIVGSLVAKPSRVGTASGATTGIYTSSSIPYLSYYETLISSSGNLQLTSTPTISTVTTPGGATPITNGTILVLGSSTAATILLQDNDTLSGSLLELGAATRSIAAKHRLTLMFDGDLGKWVEQAYQ